MNSATKSLIQELCDELKRVNPEALATLRPGLARKAILEKLGKLPYKISPSAVSLYEWADGADGPLELLPDGYFVPLQQALDEFDVWHDLAEKSPETDEPFRHCFRFLRDTSDGGYAFGRVDSPSKGRIVNLCVHDPWQLGFTDLDHLLKTSIECHRQGIMRSDQFGPNYKRFYALAAEINPKCESWGTLQKP